jgi:hypothetical protein
LQKQLRALDRGEPADAFLLGSSPAVRTRLIGRAITQQIAEQEAEKARRGLESLQRRMERIVADARVAFDRPPGRSLLDSDQKRGTRLNVFWSPVPVLAFRAWRIRGLLRGVVGAWPEPVYRAGCFGSGRERFDPEVPHTDGSCGSPPCGVYAVKEAEVLVREVGPLSGRGRVALGVVELAGKVVEHTRGYRAGHVRVVALVVAGDGRLVRVEGEGRLRRLFAAPDRTLVEIERDDPDCVEEHEGTDLPVRVIDYLEHTRLLLGAEAGVE